MAVFKFHTPISEEDVRRLKMNDTIHITGTLFTARDQAHKRMLEFLKGGKKLPIETQGLALFHCGPIVKKEHEQWRIIAAGPTTSTRMEPYEAEVIRALGIRVVIGKGGMGHETTEAMKSFGAVYGAFTGGAAVLAAKSIKTVKRVEWLDLGVPEALWVLEVESFGPLIVAIDSHGNNLYSKIMEQAEKSQGKIYRKMGLKLSEL